MSEQLPSQRCPHCGSDCRPMALDSGLGLERAYRCRDCCRWWSVEGRQESLIGALEGEQTSLDFGRVA